MAAIESEEGLIQEGLIQEGLTQEGLTQEGLIQEGLIQKGLIREGLIQEGLIQEGLIQEGLIQEGCALLAQLDGPRLICYLFPMRLSQEQDHVDGCAALALFAAVALLALIGLASLTGCQGIASLQPCTCPEAERHIMDPVLFPVDEPQVKISFPGIWSTLKGWLGTTGRDEAPQVSP